MRWKVESVKSYEVGQRRERKGFLYIPKEIRGEVRWLEYAEWIEEFKSVRGNPGPFGSYTLGIYPEYGWEPIYWKP